MTNNIHRQDNHDNLPTENRPLQAETPSIPKANNWLNRPMCLQQSTADTTSRSPDFVSYTTHSDKGHRQISDP